MASNATTVETTTTVTDQMFQELSVAAVTDLSHYSPIKGLKIIAAATAAQRYWKQAKDSRQLLQATAQAQYVIWRDTVVVPSRKNGAPGRGKRISIQQPVLPKADPGHLVAHRWRKRLCSKTSNGTPITLRRASLTPSPEM